MAMGISFKDRVGFTSCYVCLFFRLCNNTHDKLLMNQFILSQCQYNIAGTYPLFLPYSIFFLDCINLRQFRDVLKTFMLVGIQLRQIVLPFLFNYCWANIIFLTEIFLAQLILKSRLKNTFGGYFNLLACLEPRAVVKHGHFCNS